MKLDRHNYEEYFILYVDNELSNDQRRHVEDFVSRNPDLKEELEILAQHKLIPDNSIVFENKSILFREKELSSIDKSNYREWLLLYVDDELTMEQKQLFMDFTMTMPAVEKELNELMATKLDPETIIFPDKNLLYRKVAPTRYLSVYLRRIAAAIIIILLLGSGALLITGKRSTPTPEIVKTPAERNPEKNKQAQPNQPILSKENNSIPAEQEPVIVKNRLENSTAPMVEKNNKVILSANKKPVIDNKQEQVIADITRKTNNLPQPIETQNKKEDVAVNPSNSTGIKEFLTPEVNTGVVTNNSTQPSNFVNASYNEDAVSDQPDGKKNKLRGFFRKVTRTLEKTTKVNTTDENDRLLIAGLAIKLK